MCEDAITDVLEIARARTKIFVLSRLVLRDLAVEDRRPCMIGGCAVLDRCDRWLEQSRIAEQGDLEANNVGLLALRTTRKLGKFAGRRLHRALERQCFLCRIPGWRAEM